MTAKAKPSLQISVSGRRFKRSEQDAGLKLRRDAIFAKPGLAVVAKRCVIVAFTIEP